MRGSSAALRCVRAALAPSRAAAAARARMSSSSASAAQASARGPVAEYMARVNRSEIALDATQLHVARALERLHTQLKAYVPPDVDDLDRVVVHKSQAERRDRAAAAAAAAAAHAETFDVRGPASAATSADDEDSAMQLQGAHEAAEDEEDAAAAAAAAVTAAGPPPAGLYIYGPVGCGKTYLMDIFFATADVPNGRKQRLHFHSFMRDVILSYHRLYVKSTDALKERYDFNLLRPLAKSIAKQSTLLCFDEMQVPDIATAAILYRLFDQLRQYGVVVVATSNRSPAELYSGHFSEAYFAPWVAMMGESWDVIEVPSTVDYRRQILADLAAADAFERPFDPADPLSDSYFAPLGADADAKMDACWRHHGGGGGDGAPSPRTLAVAGRTVEVPVCTASGVARFDFADLCASPLGPADYLAIATECHTVFVDRIPAMTMQMRDQARRFISLVDALYETNTKLYCSAERAPDGMFVDVADADATHFDVMAREMMGELYDEMDYKGQVFQNKLFTGEEELFASERCVSRLCEMRGLLYRTSEHRPGFGLAGLDESQLEFDDAGQRQPTARAANGGTAAASAERPRFGQKHFFGFGWWERLVDRAGGRRRGASER